MKKKTTMFGKYIVTRRPDGTIIKWSKLNLPKLPLVKEVKK